MFMGPVVVVKRKGHRVAYQADRQAGSVSLGGHGLPKSKTTTNTVKQHGGTGHSTRPFGTRFFGCFCAAGMERREAGMTPPWLGKRHRRVLFSWGRGVGSVEDELRGEAGVLPYIDRILSKHKKSIPSFGPSLLLAMLAFCRLPVVFHLPCSKHLSKLPDFGFTLSHARRAMGGIPVNAAGHQEDSTVPDCVLSTILETAFQTTCIPLGIKQELHVAAIWIHDPTAGEGARRCLPYLHTDMCSYECLPPPPSDNLSLHVIYLIRMAGLSVCNTFFLVSICFLAISITQNKQEGELLKGKPWSTQAGPPTSTTGSTTDDCTGNQRTTTTTSTSAATTTITAVAVAASSSPQSRNERNFMTPHPFFDSLNKAFPIIFFQPGIFFNPFYHPVLWPIRGFTKKEQAQNAPSASEPRYPRSLPLTTHSSPRQYLTSYYAIGNRKKPRHCSSSSLQ
ncbi:uncharacterized protein CLUP02_06027 [Colletotrichum lupini]|uniref:Uncharacterized protein n=1 Tax=Colletotrichum lupini TaxID=145971 RepID=A0A9Q8WEN2_9PEZI|nr:uncharacterized protein CLUP02_06027 [Colletotrichum lupini]UQC80544.1 hypothetical protein CLUP02_06027 [Colletotrichum lupini]